MRTEMAAEALRLEPDTERMAARLARQIETRNFDGLADYFHPQVICRLLIPSGLLTPVGAPALISKLRQWFGDADQFSMESRQISVVGDHLHLVYRLSLREGGLRYVVEQQSYSRLEGGRITHFDLVCSGFQADAGSEA